MDTTTQQQDAQRPLRLFVNFLQQSLGADQSLGSTDGYAINNPRQYTVIGANGQVGIEGTVGGITSDGWKQAMPLLFMVAAAVIVLIVVEQK